VNITVTPRATEELKKARDARPADVPQDIRILVASQCGCGSAHFQMGFDEAQPDDTQVDLGGVTLVIDPDSAPFLEDAQVDCSDELVGPNFRIQTANGGGCGCGGGHGHHH